MKILSGLLLVVSLSACDDDSGIYLFKVKNDTDHVASVILTSGSSSLSFSDLNPSEESNYKRFSNPHKELILSVDFEADSLDFVVDLSRGYGNDKGKYSISFNITEQGNITTVMAFK